MCDCNKTTNISMGCCQPVLGPVEAYYTKFTIDRKLEEITSAITSGCCITPEEVDEKIASAKTEIEGEIPSLSGYATEEYVNAQISSQTSDFVTGEQLSSYTYNKATIDSKIPSMSGYVTMEEFGDYINRLRAEIDTLRQQVSGCCDIPPAPTPTGDTDVAVRIKYTQGEDFVMPCEEFLIGNLESFDLPLIYKRPDATAVTVGDCVAQIGQGCFEDYFQLQTVYIGSACSSIRLLAFYNCSALTTVTIAAITPPKLVENNTFEGCTSLAHIYVPAESVEAYKSARYWSAYSDLIEAMP